MMEEIEARRDIIAASPDLTALEQRLGLRVRKVLAARPSPPPLKGMLTADGGRCPVDGRPLRFDPWQAGAYHCQACGNAASGPRHDWWWAWHQHLWLAERIAEAASIAVLGGDATAGRWAADQLVAYAERYGEYPNRDNVLGPSRLFFSTYLESVWLTTYLAGAYLLREAGLLEGGEIERIGAAADEAAGIIGEFDEGLSNRQTWHNAALAAAAVWFEDADLAQRAIEGPRGLVGHLVDGFGADGLWYEGENYHLFALRGYLIGSEWARLAGLDLHEEPSARDRLTAALLAPIRSALPDGTFPARKDSRFGVSLAQPMYLESWERGTALLAAAGREADAAALAGWLHGCYRRPAPVAEVLDSYLHESGEEPPAQRARHDLSWWMLWTMGADLPAPDGGPRHASTLLEEQGLAILRPDGDYVSLECGPHGGGHGHPDRLHLTLHAGGVHWLADPGTGSYVSPDLAWYRSTLAHNAPRLGGRSQDADDAECEVFDGRGRWGWTRGRFAGLTRTVVAGPGQLVDILEFAGEEEQSVELAWHVAGDLRLLTAGRWVPDALASPFVAGVERFVPEQEGPVAWQAQAGGAEISGVFDAVGDLLRATGPGRPSDGGSRSFLIRRASGRYVRLAAVLSWAGPIEARFAGSEIAVSAGSDRIVHRQTSEGWEVEAGSERALLRGARSRPVSASALLSHRVGQELWKYTPPSAAVPHVLTPPSLDGSLDGFPRAEPILLDHDDQYRRTELPYAGPEVFSARAHLAWDETGLYVAVEVTHDQPVFRPRSAAPLHLDNEPDLIHADGIQCYVQHPDTAIYGWIICPDPDSSDLLVRGIAGSASPADVRGAWRRTPAGYVLTVGIALAGWPPSPGGDAARFDLMVNEMQPGRLRRAGQLVWTGGGGWAYLRGDRADPARFGNLELL